LVCDVSWDQVGFVKASKVRKAIIELLDKSSGLTPFEVASRLDLMPAAVSRALKELSDRGLARCLNPKRRKGRIYALTTGGSATLELLRRTRP
jgi:predicted ArsR family transcriptional regulator